jgi:hypothetical protein
LTQVEAADTEIWLYVCYAFGLSRSVATALVQA